MSDERERVLADAPASDATSEHRRLHEVLEALERHIAEDGIELADQQGRFEALIANSPVGIAVWRGPDLVCEVVNPAYEVFAPGKRFLGKRYGQVWPEAEEPYSSLMRRVMRTGEPYYAEDVPVRIRRSDGGQLEQAFFNISLARLPADSAGRVGVLNIAVETTKHVEAADALRSSEERYRALFESIDEGFCIIEMLYDREGRPHDYRFLEANPAFARQTGLTDTVGKTVLELVPGQEQHWFDIYGRIDRTGLPERFEQVAEALGRYYSVFAFRIGRPEEHHVAVLFEDISGRKQAERRRAEVERELQESLDLAQALNRANELLLSSEDREDVFTEALSEATRVLGADYGVVSLKDDADWRVAYTSGGPDVPGTVVPAGYARATERIARSGGVFMSEDALSDERLRTDYCARMGIRSFLHVPLSVRGRVVGLLSFLNTIHARRFTDGQVSFAEHVASSVSLALENARAFAAEVEALREVAQELDTTRLLLEAADTLANWTSLEGVLAALTDILLRATAHSRVTISLWDERARSLEVRTVAGEGAFKPMTLPFDHLTPALRHLLATGETAVNDYDALPARERDIAEKLGSHLTLQVALRHRDRVLGVVGIDDPGERREFSEREIAIVEAIASQAAVAVENARLYLTERSIADRLQEALLALPDEVPGIAFAHAYHSATEAARVGGDFYDVFILDDDRIGILIGDVAGKGLDAAVLTSTVKNSIRAHASEPGKGPRRALELTNSVLYRTTSEQSFVTVWFGVLEYRTGRLTYSNAGHTAPALVAGPADVATLPVNGPPLGAFADVELREETASLDVGELLFLYTDGLTEARRGDELYGEDRLFGLLALAEHGTAPDVVATVIEDVLAFSDNRLGDDLAILALRRVASDAEVEKPRHEFTI